MQFLRMVILMMAVITFGSVRSFAQTQEQLQSAFKASYANEWKGNYAGALSELKKVYKADSYEANLRMGWLNYNLKDYTAAMQYYQKAIDLKKYSVEARLGF